MQKGTAAMLVDDSGTQVWELRGANFDSAVIGKKARVVGVIDTTATPVAGAQRVVTYGSIKTVSRGGCSGAATRIGGTAVAGTGLAVAGASAASATATAAAATAVGGGVGVGVAAGVSTALIVGGVAAAAGVTAAVVVANQSN